MAWKGKIRNGYCSYQLCHRMDILILVSPFHWRSLWWHYNSKKFISYCDFGIVLQFCLSLFEGWLRPNGFDMVSSFVSLAFMFFSWLDRIYKNLFWLSFGFDRQLRSAFPRGKWQSFRRISLREDLFLKLRQRKDMTTQLGQYYLDSLSLW